MDEQEWMSVAQRAMQVGGKLGLLEAAGEILKRTVDEGQAKELKRRLRSGEELNDEETVVVGDWHMNTTALSLISVRIGADMLVKGDETWVEAEAFWPMYKEMLEQIGKMAEWFNAWAKKHGFTSSGYRLERVK
jgi:hypothetical protein